MIHENGILIHIFVFSFKRGSIAGIKFQFFDFIFTIENYGKYPLATFVFASSKVHQQSSDKNTAQVKYSYYYIRKH